MLNKVNSFTSEYIVYMLDLRLKRFMTEFGFIDSYLGDDGHPIHYENCIYIRCKPNFDEVFEEYCKELQNNKDFVIEYDLPNDEVMFVFKVPNIYIKDIKNFKKGKYSELNKHYVSKFGVKDYRFQVCNKSKLLKRMREKEFDVILDEDAELDSIPIPENEIFRYDYTKNNW